MPFRPAALGDVRALVRRVVASGRAWVAPTTFEGQDVVRICATNGETAIADVDALVAALNERSLNAGACARMRVNQRLDRAQGMEIFRRDIGLRNGDIELHLDRKHQIHHFQGTDAEIAQLRVQREWARDHAAGAQHRLDERNQLLAHPILHLRIHSECFS